MAQIDPPPSTYPKSSITEILWQNPVQVSQRFGKKSLLLLITTNIIYVFSPTARDDQCCQDYLYVSSLSYLIRESVSITLDIESCTQGLVKRTYILENEQEAETCLRILSELYESFREPSILGALLQPPVVLEGPLKLPGKGGILSGNSAAMWGVLTPAAFALYPSRAKRQSRPEYPTQCWPTNHLLHTELISQDRFQFAIIMKFRPKPFLFGAETVFGMRKWLSILGKTSDEASGSLKLSSNSRQVSNSDVNEGGEGEVRDRRLSLADEKGLQEDLDDIRLRGSFLKKNNIGRWQKRIFRLEEGCIYYYESEARESKRRAKG